MTRNRGVLMAIGAGLSLVLLVGIVQVLGPAIEPVDPFGVSGAVQKKAQMEQVAEQGPMDVVFTGTSQILVSLDPAIVTAESGLSTYNASLTGSTPRIQQDWLLDTVVPILQPKQVVLGVSHLDLLDESPRLNEVIDNWNAGRLNKDGLLADVDRELSESVTLIDRRQSLRDPAEWVRALLRRAAGDEAAMPGVSKTLTETGLDEIWADLEYHGEEETIRFTKEEVVPTYSVGDRQSEALRKILDDLQDQGIEVVLLMMPLTQDLIDVHPDGQADVDEGVAALEELASDAGVEILRYDSGPWPIELFADPLHLNGKGAELFSHLVAADLAASPDGILRGGDHSDAGDAAIAAFSDEG